MHLCRYAFRVNVVHVYTGISHAAICAYPFTISRTLGMHA